jgi:hypothetical protein
MQAKTPVNLAVALLTVGKPIRSSKYKNNKNGGAEQHAVNSMR